MLQRLLFEPTLVRSPLRVVQWWERRRLAFNVAVGTAGIGTVIYVNAISLLVKGEWFDAPYPWLILAYGLTANLCYTAGWIVENLAERWLKRPVYGLGPALFRHGLVFSIGLTLFPAALITVAAIGSRLFP